MNNKLHISQVRYLNLTRAELVIYEWGPHSQNENKALAFKRPQFIIWTLC